MAKNISVTAALSALLEAGLELTPEQQETFAAMRASEYKSQVQRILSGDGEKFEGKLSEDFSPVQEKNDKRDVSEFAADSLLSFSSLFADMVKGEAKTIQGGAVRTVRRLTIEVPDGTFTIELKSE